MGVSPKKVAKWSIKWRSRALMAEAAENWADGERARMKLQM